MPLLMTAAKERVRKESLDRAQGPCNPSSFAPYCRQQHGQHGHPQRGMLSTHMLSDGHKCLDVCLEFSHVTLDLTVLTALLLLLVPYTSPTLCPSEAVLVAQFPRPLRRLAAEDMLLGNGCSWGWAEDVVSTQTIPCPGMARLGFRRNVGEGAFCTGLTGG